MVKPAKKTRTTKQVLSIYLDADQLERMRKAQNRHFDLFLKVPLAEQVRRAINIALDIWEGKK